MHIPTPSDWSRWRSIVAASNKSTMIASPGRKADRFPIIVAEWPRNSRELVRISLDRFNNRFTINIRSWSREANGTFKPSRNGLTLAVGHLPKLADGFVNALQRAEVLGLVETGANDRSLAEQPHRYRQRRR